MFIHFRDVAGVPTQICHNFYTISRSIDSISGEWPKMDKMSLYTSKAQVASCLGTVDGNHEYNNISYSSKRRRHGGAERHVSQTEVIMHTCGGV